MKQKPRTRPVVANLQYGGAYRASLEEAERTGKCPFCQPEYRAMALMTPYSGWFVVNVREEFRQSDREGQKPPYQLLFVSLTHRDDTKLPTLADWFAIAELLRRCKRKFGIRGGCLFLRDGDPDCCGRTVRHPHVHYYVPRMVRVPRGGKGRRSVPIDIAAG